MNINMNMKGDDDDDEEEEEEDDDDHDHDDEDEDEDEDDDDDDDDDDATRSVPPSSRLFASATAQASSKASVLPFEALSVLACKAVTFAISK